MTTSEYHHFATSTSSGMSDADAARMRVLTVDEKCGQEFITTERKPTRAMIRERLTAARNLVAHLEQQLAATPPRRKKGTR